MKLEAIYEDSKSIFLVTERTMSNICEILSFYNYSSEDLIASFFRKILVAIDSLKKGNLVLKLLIPKQIQFKREMNCFVLKLGDFICPGFVN